MGTPNPQTRNAVKSCRVCSEEYELSHYEGLDDRRDNVCKRCAFRARINSAARAERQCAPFETEAEACFWRIVKTNFPDTLIVNQFGINNYCLISSFLISGSTLKWTEDIIGAGCPKILSEKLLLRG